MQCEEMEAVMREEMGHISEGEYAHQGQLRMHYNSMRRSELAKPASLQMTRGQVLNDCITCIRRDNPDAQPRYDAEFFRD